VNGFGFSSSKPQEKNLSEHLHELGFVPRSDLREIDFVDDLLD